MLVINNQVLSLSEDTKEILKSFLHILVFFPLNSLENRSAYLLTTLLFWQTLANNVCLVSCLQLCQIRNFLPNKSEPSSSSGWHWGIICALFPIPKINVTIPKINVRIQCGGWEFSIFQVQSVTRAGIRRKGKIQCSCSLLLCVHLDFASKLNFLGFYLFSMC